MSTTSNVLIVARTRMGERRRCIGAIAEDGASLRLLTRRGQNFDDDVPFEIGQIWRLTYAPRPQLQPPHVEDVCVTKRRLVGEVSDLRESLLEWVEPWRGGIVGLFEGLVRFTTRGNGYISEWAGVPEWSTEFWVLERALRLREDGAHYDEVSGARQDRKGLKYVGEPPPRATIPAGTLVRVSLARWWKPYDADPDFEERCYLQLSGWY